jgi:hypothetical protein
MAGRYERSSPYYGTPIRNWYLDIWQGVSIEATGRDLLYSIPPEFNLRPDLAAFNFYGSPKYWWVFALRNKNLIKDPIQDFIAGRIIYIPAKEAIPGL